MNSTNLFATHPFNIFQLRCHSMEWHLTTELQPAKNYIFLFEYICIFVLVFFNITTVAISVLVKSDVYAASFAKEFTCFLACILLLLCHWCLAYTLLFNITEITAVVFFKNTNTKLNYCKCHFVCAWICQWNQKLLLLLFQCW